MCTQGKREWAGWETRSRPRATPRLALQPPPKGVGHALPSATLRQVPLRKKRPCGCLPGVWTIQIWAFDPLSRGCVSISVSSLFVSQDGKKVTRLAKPAGQLAVKGTGRGWGVPLGTEFRWLPGQSAGRSVSRLHVVCDRANDRPGQRAGWPGPGGDWPELGNV